MSPGDEVRVRGAVSEYNGLTEITASQIRLCSTGNTVPPRHCRCRWPVSTAFEAYEGMLVTFPQPLVISEYFNFDRYGEIVLTSERHLPADGAIRAGRRLPSLRRRHILLNRITLDDGRTTQNPDPAIHPNGGRL